MTNKESILQTALQLFGEQGYDRTPTNQIAKAANVSEGLIFRHFGSKAGLLEAIVEQGMVHVTRSMESYLNSNAGPRQAIIQHIDRSLTAIRENEQFWRLATQIRFQASVREVVGDKLEAANQTIVEHLRNHFRKINNEDPDQQALLLFAQIDGICLHWLQDTQNYPLEKMKQLLIKIYNHAYF